MNFLNPLPQRVAKRKKRIVHELGIMSGLFALLMGLSWWQLPTPLTPAQQQLLRHGLPAVQMPAQHSILPSFTLWQNLYELLEHSFAAPDIRLVAATVEPNEAELLLLLHTPEQALNINQWQLPPWQLYRYAVEHEEEQVIARIKLRMQP